MIDAKDLVLDANILIRGVLGNRVGRLIELHQEAVRFFSPEICFADARRHISELVAKLKRDPAIALDKLDRLAEVIATVSPEDYGMYQEAAVKRIRARDTSDWPIVASSLLLKAPLWTEDRDFFGCGLATWTSDRVELYLRRS